MIARWLFWIRSYVAHLRGIRALNRGDYVTLDQLERTTIDDPYCND